MKRRLKRVYYLKGSDDAPIAVTDEEWHIIATARRVEIWGYSVVRVVDHTSARVALETYAPVICDGLVEIP